MKLFTLLLTIICILGFALNNANAGLRGGALAIQKSRLPPSNDELFDRWSFGGSTPSYSYGGTTYNRGGYNANPSSSAINNAQRNGALSNYEATRYGIKNYRNGRCTNCDENDELFDRWSFGGSTPSYSYGGTTYNRGGYNANPSSSAINNAQRNGALSNYEATRYGIKNYRNGRCTNCDENEETVGQTYRSNGYTMNSRGYLANPSRSNQIKARNAGALTNSEARSMGLNNYRGGRITNDEMEEMVGRPSYTMGNGNTYRSGGHTMNSRGYLANPSRSNQIKARNAGALTNSEARSMGLNNYRGGRITNDEMEETVGQNCIFCTQNNK